MEKNKKEEPPRNVKTNQIRESKTEGEGEEKKDEEGGPKVKKDLVRDSNTIKDYYKAWDQYDIDKELTKL
jgi:hypothetical protein